MTSLALRVGLGALVAGAPVQAQTGLELLTAADGAPGNRFGTVVALSGTVAVVGSPFAAPGGVTDAGAAYVFEDLSLIHI